MLIKRQKSKQTEVEIIFKKCQLARLNLKQDLRESALLSPHLDFCTTDFCFSGVCGSLDERFSTHFHPSP